MIRRGEASLVRATTSGVCRSEPHAFVSFTQVLHVFPVGFSTGFERR